MEPVGISLERPFPQAGSGRISSAKASCRRPIKDGFLASSLPGCLAPWLPGGLAPGRPETVPRDPPDPRMWLTGLAPGRPETIPRADPQDPGPGGRFPLFVKGNEVFNGGGPEPPQTPRGVFWRTPPTLKLKL